MYRIKHIFSCCCAQEQSMMKIVNLYCLYKNVCILYSFILINHVTWILSCLQNGKTFFFSSFFWYYSSETIFMITFKEKGIIVVVSQCISNIYLKTTKYIFYRTTIKLFFFDVPIHFKDLWWKIENKAAARFGPVQFCEISFCLIKQLFEFITIKIIYLIFKVVNNQFHTKSQFYIPNDGLWQSLNIWHLIQFTYHHF